MATRFAFYQDIWKKVHQILREDVFFAGGSLGAMNGLYRYRKELLLRAAEGMSLPCKILWNEMLQIRLTAYISIFIYFGFWKMGVNLKLFHNSFSHFSQFEKFVIANNTRYNLVCNVFFFINVISFAKNWKSDHLENNLLYSVIENFPMSVNGWYTCTGTY